MLRPPRIDRKYDISDEVNRLDFAEAYLVALAEASGVGRIVSFDRSIDRVDTVTRDEP